MAKRSRGTAPVLTALLQDLTRQAARPRRKSYPMPGDAQVARIATAELRALVAAARSQDRLLTFAAGFIGGAGLVRRDLWTEYPELERARRVRDRLASATEREVARG